MIDMKEILDRIRRLVSKSFLCLTMAMVVLFYAAFFISILIMVLLVIATIVDKCGFSGVAKVLAYPGRLFRYLGERNMEIFMFVLMGFGFLAVLFQRKSDDGNE